MHCSRPATAARGMLSLWTQAPNPSVVSSHSQAGMPRAPVGQLMGRVMAVLNADMERRAADRLSVSARSN